MVRLSAEAPLLIWLLAVAFLSLTVYLLVQRAFVSRDDPGKRLALLVGASRAWGETAASVRQRSEDLSRWPYKQHPAEFVWWARACRIIWRARDR
jgi:hypothetical protein